MTVQVRNQILIDLRPLWAGTTVGYRMAYLSPAQKKSLGLAPKQLYAVRIDGVRASLVRC